MADLTYAFASSMREWARVWARHIADHGPGRLVDAVAERKSLYDQPYRVFVVDADASIVDETVVDNLHRRGRAVLVVWDPADPRTKEMALRLGADAVIEADATAEEFVRMASRLAGDDLAEGRAVLTEPVQPPSGEPAWPSPRAGGYRVAVAGPVGEEAEEVTVELARALARRGELVVVVDANDVSPCVAQRLGLPILPNLRIAVDAVRDRRLSLTDALLAVPAGGFWVLGGLADPGQWAEVRPAEVAEVVDELAAASDVVLAQAGPLAEDLAEAGGSDRFGITRRLVAEADAIVAVARASPTGVARLVAWLADVRPVAPLTPLHVVLTGAPKDAFRRNELAERVRADAEPASVGFLPADRRIEAAAWDGTFVAPGPYTKAVADLAAVVPVRGLAARGPRRTGGG